MAAFPFEDGAGALSVHDVGGAEALASAPVPKSDKPLQRWEVETHALLVLLVSASKMKVDELRAGIEALEPVKYLAWGYYDKWAASMARASLTHGYVTEDALNGALGAAPTTSEPVFKPGDVVRVRRDDARLSRWRKPHIRVPGYVFGATGVVEEYRGQFGDPEFLAFGATTGDQPLYTVRFTHRALGWDEDASICAEVYQPWLEKADSLESSPVQERGETVEHDDHDHDRYDTELHAVEKQTPEAPGERLISALLATLRDGGHVDIEQFRRITSAVETLAAPMTPDAIGPRLVARAWKDPAFKTALLADAHAALMDTFDFNATNSTAPTKLIVVADEPKKRNLVVCTLCSCYPLSVLGLSPSWYKDVRYRAKAVRSPRKLLLDDFGLDLDDQVEIVVWDSTADCRYMVLPESPQDAADLTEAELAARVTRDSMIGVGRVLPPVV